MVFVIKEIPYVHLSDSSACEEFVDDEVICTKDAESKKMKNQLELVQVG